MINNVLGVFLSFLYFFFCLFIPRMFKSLSLEVKRKIVHILLGNWWIIVNVFFDSVIFASIVPVSFIFINYFSLKRNRENGLLSSLERRDAGKSYGIVLYPIAMELLVILSFCVFKDVRAGGIGLLALAYGDGFAAIIGKKYNYKPIRIFNNTKSLSGCIAMFAASFISISIYLFVFPLIGSGISVILTSIILSVSAAIVELLSPNGTDNITIPVTVLLLFYYTAL